MYDDVDAGRRSTADPGGHEETILWRSVSWLYVGDVIYDLTLSSERKQKDPNEIDVLDEAKAEKGKLKLD